MQIMKVKLSTCITAIKLPQTSLFNVYSLSIQRSWKCLLLPLRKLGNSVAWGESCAIFLLAFFFSYAKRWMNLQTHLNPVQSLPTARTLQT